MSIPLPPISLSGKVVGSTGKIDLSSIQISANSAFLTNPPTLQIFNDSGCGLQLTMATGGDGYNFPAGAWANMPLAPGESAVNFSVIYVLPNAPVSTLMATYYAPGETPVTVPQLGNSPIGGGVSSVVTTASNLDNEGSPAGAIIMQARPAGDSQFPVSLDNKGNLTLGDTTYSPAVDIIGTLSVFAASGLDNGTIVTDGSGHVSMNDSGSVTNGTTAGTVTAIQPFRGNGWKIVVIQFLNYNNTTAPQQVITLPTAFTNGAFFWVGGVTNPNTSGVYFLNSGAAVSTNAVHNGATTTGTGRVPCFSLGEVLGAFTGFKIDGNLTGASTGWLILIGE